MKKQQINQIFNLNRRQGFDLWQGCFNFHHIVEIGVQIGNEAVFVDKGIREAIEPHTGEIGVRMSTLLVTSFENTTDNNEQHVNCNVHYLTAPKVLLEYL